MAMLEDVLKTIDGRRDQSLAQLKDFLSIPSISAQPDHKPDMQRCAQWLADQLKFAAMDVAIMPTGTFDKLSAGTFDKLSAGHPCVVAKNKHQAGRPTVLLYGHYDVQPPEPLEQWTTGPFEPTVRGGAIYARGAADDKGQVWAHVEAITAWQAHGGPPINLTVVIEGEEEIGSDHLPPFFQEHREALRADIAVISDTNQFAKGLPAITYGLRGLCYAEVFITGPSHDLHSGLFGGAVVNPANLLCEIVASLHDEKGRVTIPGFYDDVVPLTETERALWRKLPFSDDDFAKRVGLKRSTGEEGYSAIERKWARPTCDVNGITTGYQGPGAKTVIPSTASMKISMRLVPNQDPEKIQAAFEKAICAKCGDQVQVRFIWHGASKPVLVPIDSRPMQLAAEAVAQGFGIKPTLMREGGSIPVVGLIKQTLGIDTLLVGFGLPDDRVHSPNEKFDLDALHGGTRSAAVLYQKLSQLR
jgi:acetylornithine deacetylase/succinyl-diaminopimelate desuccinylase-like protein